MNIDVSHALIFLCGIGVGVATWSAIIIGKTKITRSVPLSGAVKYYGDRNTEPARKVGQLLVETHAGRVIGCWFRKLPVPFKQIEVDEQRARLVEQVAAQQPKESLDGILLRRVVTVTTANTHGFCSEHGETRDRILQIEKSSGKKQTDPPTHTRKGGHPDGVSNL